MPLYDVRCQSGHEAERWAKWDERDLPCHACGQPTERVWRTNKGSRHADVTWPGGKVFENGFSEPQRFYSPCEYHAALAANGLTVRGDGEESATWISKETIENAKALVNRCP